MAYQIKKSERVKETLELLYKNGNIAERVEISLDADAVVEKVSKRYM